jgi:SRSO17 transposase
MSSRSKAEHWAQELEAGAGRIAPQFGRAEPRRRALTYLQGLLAPLERKNGWHLAEAAGDCSPHGMQEFLSRVHWDADALRDDLRAYVVEHLGDDDAVLVLDETGSGRWTRIEDSWVVDQRVGWWAMSGGGEPWRGLLSI